MGLLTEESKGTKLVLIWDCEVAKFITFETRSW